MTPEQLEPIKSPERCGVTRPNIAGQRFGRLIAVREVGQRKTQIYWECRCDCGNTKVTQLGSLQIGLTRSCNCLRDKPPGESNRNNRYLLYRLAARGKGHAFELTPDDFLRLTQLPCYYCGLPPSTRHQIKGHHGAFIYTGLDRCNNRLGYTLDNVVPCCWQCNRSKHYREYDEFVSWLDRVAAFRSRDKASELVS